MINAILIFTCLNSPVTSQVSRCRGWRSMQNGFRHSRRTRVWPLRLFSPLCRAALSVICRRHRMPGQCWTEPVPGVVGCLDDDVQAGFRPFGTWPVDRGVPDRSCPRPVGARHAQRAVGLQIWQPRHFWPGGRSTTSSPRWAISTRRPLPRSMFRCSSSGRIWAAWCGILSAFAVLTFAAMRQVRKLGGGELPWLLSFGLFLALPMALGAIRNGQATILSDRRLLASHLVGARRSARRNLLLGFARHHRQADRDHHAVVGGRPAPAADTGAGAGGAVRARLTLRFRSRRLSQRPVS